jgi:hypothetical protein
LINREAVLIPVPPFPRAAFIILKVNLLLAGRQARFQPAFADKPLNFIAFLIAPSGNV